MARIGQRRKDSMSKPAFVYLVAAARKIWRWSPERRKVKLAAKVGDKYRCAKCKKFFEKVDVDHIEPVGKAPRSWDGWDEYYKKLFCSEQNLTVLCKVHHKEKSKQERADGKYKTK